MKNNKIAFYAFTAIIIALTVAVTFIKFTNDATLNGLITGTTTRVLVTVFILVVIKGNYDVLRFNVDKLGKKLLWLIPCCLVVIANFPFYAIVIGMAKIERYDLIWLFALECLSIGVLEEICFRGVIHTEVKSKMTGKKNGYFWSVVISSGIFALWHLVNLFYGGGLSVILQVGYSFLIGAMLAVTFDVTENIWFSVILHTLFDFGGNLISTLGRGEFQDAVFWIMTAVCGIICAVSVILTVIKRNKAVE